MIFQRLIFSFCCFMLGCCLLSCASDSNRKSGGVNSDDYSSASSADDSIKQKLLDSVDRIPAPGSAASFLPNQGAIDSLEILYYDNPQDDSLRYTRFFTFLATSNQELRTQIDSMFWGSYQQMAQVPSDRSDGKIYCYYQGEVVKTIYFKAMDVSNNIRFAYFIHNGNYFMLPNQDQFYTLLKNLRSKAIRPKAQN